MPATIWFLVIELEKIPMAVKLDPNDLLEHPLATVLVG